MSARDIFHASVKTALQKDGWTITHDPLTLEYETVEVHIDLGAERLIAAQKDGSQIAVEIKSFLSGSAISDFHTALGQFLNYRIVLSVKAPERILLSQHASPKLPTLVGGFSCYTLLFRIYGMTDRYVCHKPTLGTFSPSQTYALPVHSGLVLAVPAYTYETFFQTALAKAAVQQYQLKLIIYEPDEEVIVKWID